MIVGVGERTHACNKHVRSRVFATRLHTCFPHFQSGPRITCEPTTIEEAGCTGTAAAVAAGCTGLAADAGDTADADAAGWTGLAAEPGVACVGRGSGAAFSSRVADPAAARDGEMGMLVNIKAVRSLFRSWKRIAPITRASSFLAAHVA